ncbi:hypothetical protein AB0M48_11895 [Lentzea sp. NPDC051208]|uniref:hypothetical protein n=1 Tax=Lentzea sp. NPDC051208 TaxID=3154642 RepID=UPI00342DFE00
MNTGTDGRFFGAKANGVPATIDAASRWCGAPAQYVRRVNEVELTFIINSHELVVLKAGKLRGVLSLGDDFFARIHASGADATNTDWSAPIGSGWPRPTADRMPATTEAERPPSRAAPNSARLVATNGHTTCGTPAASAAAVVPHPTVVYHRVHARNSQSCGAWPITGTSGDDPYDGSHGSPPPSQAVTPLSSFGFCDNDAVAVIFPSVRSIRCSCCLFGSDT